MTARSLVILLVLLPTACSQPAEKTDADFMSRYITDIAFCQEQEVRVSVQCTSGLGEHAEQLVTAIGDELERSGFVVILPKLAASPDDSTAATRPHDVDMRIELLEQAGQVETWVLRLFAEVPQFPLNPVGRPDEPLASIIVAPETAADGTAVRGLVRSLLDDPQGSTVHGLLLGTPYRQSACMELARHLAEHPGVRAVRLLGADPQGQSIKIMVLQDPATDDDLQDLFDGWDGVVAWVTGDGRLVYPGIDELVGQQLLKDLFQED